LIDFLTRECALRQIRFTGGEPLLHHSLIELIAATREIAPHLNIAMTTNGQRLKQLAKPLRAAGLDRLNISLDTLDGEVYRRLTGGDLKPVLEGIDQAAQEGFDPIKINMVVLRDINHHELSRLVRWSAERGFVMRFLEAMPIGPAAEFNRKHFVSQHEMLSSLAGHYQVCDLGRSPGATARRYALTSGKSRVEVGIVAPVSAPFCGDCRRMRLSSEGRLFPCLLDSQSVDLAPHLWAEEPSCVLRIMIRVVLKAKAPTGRGQTRPMIQLGG